jgi:DNA-binding transcriptional ArsR family regulator
MGRAVDRETVVLRALASPVRQDILEILRRAPATAAMVARAIGSNTGVTSYHLRELGKAALIEPDARSGRSLFWRLSDADVRFSDPQLSTQPDLAQAAIDLRLARFTASVRDYLARTDLEPAWRDASLFSESAPALTDSELAEFSAAYLALVGRWSAPRVPAAGARPVRLALFAYPEHESSTSEGQTDEDLDR